MKLLKELGQMIRNFIYPSYLDEPLLKMPLRVKNMGVKIEILYLVMTISSLIFAFMLKITNLMIELKLFLVGVIFYMLYRGQSVLDSAFNIYLSSEKTKFDLIFDDEITLKGTNIIGVTKDRVLKFDEKSNIYRLMDNETILNTIKNYLRNLWWQQIKHRFDILKIICVVLMIITSIVTNAAIPNSLYIFFIIFFVLLSFFSSAYINLSRSSFYKRNREYDNEQSVIINDLLRVPLIVDDDLSMRIDRFKKSVIKSNNNTKKFYKKMNITSLLMNLVDTFSQWGIIIFYVMNINLTSLTLVSIAEISATLLIVETAISYTRRLVYSLDDNNERILALFREEEDMRLILDTYYNLSNAFNNEEVNSINLKPFTIKYLKESINDIPFTLKSNSDISINKGDVVTLYGVSGSGKTTFMNMLMGRIRLEKGIDIPITRRFLVYNEKLKFGSLSIYEELFCDSNSADLVKMESILKALHLWEEIQFNSEDVWQYFKEKKFEHSLSNGQRQRLILAKLLYFLDDKIDVLMLDECTSGVDDDNYDSIDACDILDYIVRFANRDKKRIVIVSTHQNIDRFKNNICDEYNVRNFRFVKEQGYNLIKEFGGKKSGKL